MNTVELKNKLDKLEIPTHDYSLDGSLKPMRTILSFSSLNWFTFEYDEHGKIHEKRQFDTENNACEDMLQRLIDLREWRKKYNVI